MIKIEIKTKIKLMYDLKCKYYAKRRWIRMKTHNLTQSRTHNDPINRRIQGFSFRDFENEVRRSRYDFFWLFQPILYFKHSSDAKMSLEEVEIKWFSNCDV